MELNSYSERTVVSPDPGQLPELGSGGSLPPGHSGGQAACGAGGYLVIVSVSSVTAAVRASALPWMVTPVVTVIEARAMMFPLKVE